MTTVTLYFDVISPYAYLAWRRLPQVLKPHGAALEAVPVLFAGLLDHWGQKGPAEIPPKRVHTFKTVFREAGKHGIPLKLPATHPFNPLLALRLCSRAAAGAAQFAVIDALFRAGWERGEELGSPDVIAAALTGAGLPAAELLAKAATPAAKDALKHAGAQAIALGVFGVPTMVVDGGEAFWGHDQLDNLSAYLAGTDRLDRAALAEALSRPASAARAKSLT